MSPPAPLADGAQGGLVVRVENSEVVVGRLAHARLTDAALASVEADLLEDESVTRYEV